MRKGALAVVAVGVSAAMLVSGCSSSSGGAKKTGGSSAPASKGSSSAGGGSSSGKPAVGVILPDTTTSNRYTLYDAPLLKKAFDAAGIKSDIQNAQGSNSRPSSPIAQTMISEGVKVLLIDPADPATGISVEKSARPRGRPGHRLRPGEPRRLGDVLRLVRQREGRRAAGARPWSAACRPSAARPTRTSSSSTAAPTSTTTPCCSRPARTRSSTRCTRRHLKSRARRPTSRAGTTPSQRPTSSRPYTQDPNVDGVLAANDGIAAAAIAC